MRIPKPRLRQVFEHTTSFKVKKPTGQTITIAKKGLSPSTIGRLRRFAQGGEVQNYQVGGEVPNADDAAFADEEAKMRESQRLIEAAIEGTKAQPPAAEAAPAAEGQAAPMPQRRVVTVAANEAAQAAPTPAQPTINIINAPAPQPAAPAAPQAAAMMQAQPAAAPVAATQRIEAAPTKAKATEPAAPTAPAPEPATAPKPAPVTTPAAAQPIASAEAELPEVGTALRPELGFRPSLPVGRLEPIVAAPMPTALASPTLAMPEAAAPTLPAVTPEEAAQFVEAPAPVAPATVPVAPVTVAAPAAVTPVSAAVALPVPAAPQLPDVLTDDQIEELVGVAPPAYQPAMRMALVGQRNQQLVERQQAEQQAAAMAASERRMSDALAKVESDIAQIRQKRADIQGEIQAARNEGNVFSRMGVIEKIGTILAMGVAGFAAGYAGIPNYALQAFNQALDRDLERQRRRGDSLLNELKLVTATEKDAEQLYRGIAKEAVAIEAKRAELQATTQKSRAAYGAVAGKFALDAYKEIAEVESKFAGAAAAQARAAGELTAEEKLAVELGKQRQKNEMIDLERRRVAEAERAHRAAEEARRKNLADKEEKERRERILNVGNVEVELARKTQATKIQRDLALRNQGIRALDDVVYTIENATPQSLANRLSDDYIKASAGIKAFKETFLTGATGADRAIAVTAGRVVDEALNNPLSFTKLALGQNKIALNGFLTKFKKGRETFIRDMALPGQDLAPALKALEEEDQYFSSRPKFGFQPAGGK